MSENNELKRIVAPIKIEGQEKPFWMRLGIAGRKNDKIWIRLSNVPLQWDGYALLVDWEAQGADDEKKDGKPATRKPAGSKYNAPPAASEAGDGENVPF